MSKFEHIEIASGLWRMAGGCENAGNPEAAACLDKAAKIVHASAHKDQALEEAAKALRLVLACRAQDPFDDAANHAATKWLDLYGKEGV